MAAVNVGQFDYSHSSSSSSASSSVSTTSSHATDPTPERQRGPSHREPAAYFFSEGAISPGSHTAVYARGQTHRRTDEADNGLEWSPSSSISAGTSPHSRGLDVTEKNPVTAADGAVSLSSTSRSRSSSGQPPRISNSREPSASSPATTTQFTLPTLRPVRSESETSVAAVPGSLEDGATNPTATTATKASTEPRRLSTTRSFDREDAVAEAEAVDGPPSPLPAALGVPNDDKTTANGSARANASRTKERETRSPSADTAAVVPAPRRRLGSPGHAATHSPHKRALPTTTTTTGLPHRPAAPPQQPPQPRRRGTTPSPGSTIRGESVASSTASVSQPRRSASTQAGLQYDYCYQDDDLDEDERPPSLSPPPKMRPDDDAARDPSPVPFDSSPEVEVDGAVPADPAQGDVTTLLRDRLSSPRAPSKEGINSNTNSSEQRPPTTLPRAVHVDATTTNNNRNEADPDGVVRSPVPSALRRRPRSSHTNTENGTAAPSASSEARASAPPKSVSRSPSVSASEPADRHSSPSQLCLEASKRRLCLHTVSADRGRTPSIHRSRHSSLEASLAGSALHTNNDSDDVVDHLRDAASTGRKQRRERSAESDTAAAATPLLLTILHSGTDEGREASRKAPERDSERQTRGIGAPPPLTGILVSHTTFQKAVRALPFKPAPVTPETSRVEPAVPTAATQNGTAANGTHGRHVGLFSQRTSSFLSSAIRPRGAGNYVPSENRSDTTTREVAYTHAPNRLASAASPFRVELVPYVSTRPSPKHAQEEAFAVDATHSHPIVRAKRGTTTATTTATTPTTTVRMNDSATSPIVASHAAPSSLWSSYSCGTLSQSEAARTSPQPRDPRRADAASRPFQGTPERPFSHPPPLPHAHTRDGNVPAAKPPQPPSFAHDAVNDGDATAADDAEWRERALFAIEENELVTRLIGRNAVLHAESCDREKLRLLESHFWRTLQTEWCYLLTADHLLQAQEAERSQQRTPRYSPPASAPLAPHTQRSPSSRTLFDAFAQNGSGGGRPGMSSSRARVATPITATALERIMDEQTALADELQYLSGALADLMEQHA